MRQLRENSFSERQKASADAKKQLLSKFKTAPKPDDPSMVAKRAEREAIAAAREARRVERERLKQEETAREEALAEAARQAEAQRQAEEEARLRAEEEVRKEEDRKLADHLLAIEAEKKAERDRRYAARKARRR